MRKVVVSEFVTLDGVMEDPGGAEGFERGAWSFQFDRGPEGDKFKFDELAAADALLLGRVTYEGFAAAWPQLEEQTGEYGSWMNGYPKHVASTTLEEPLKSSIVPFVPAPSGVAQTSGRCTGRAPLYRGGCAPDVV